MNELTKPVSLNTLKQLPMTTFVTGKIDFIRRFNGEVFTIMVCPSSDEYSQPKTIEIRSKKSLGQVGDIVDFYANLSGYKRKPYFITDEDSGERIKIVRAENTLDFQDFA